MEPFYNFFKEALICKKKVTKCTEMCYNMEYMNRKEHTMNVYDEANDLAKALKESQEYKKFKDAELNLKTNEEHYAMARNYAQKQMTLQAKQMMGQELSDDEIETYNSLTSSILSVPSIAAYFQAQMQFGVVFQDVMDIISKAVDLDMNGMLSGQDEEA